MTDAPRCPCPLPVSQRFKKGYRWDHLRSVNHFKKHILFLALRHRLVKSVGDVFLVGFSERDDPEPRSCGEMAV